MRLLLSWVRDFVDVNASAEEVAETLGLRGFEVAAVEPLGANDAVIDFEVTANRPDCLSVLGFAREIGTAYDLPVRLPSADPKAKLGLAKVESGESDRLNVSLEDAELCPRYGAAVATVSATTTPGCLMTGAAGSPSDTPPSRSRSQGRRASRCYRAARPQPLDTRQSRRPTRAASASALSPGRRTGHCASC